MAASSSPQAGLVVVILATVTCALIIAATVTPKWYILYSIDGDDGIASNENGLFKNCTSRRLGGSLAVRSSCINFFDTPGIDDIDDGLRSAQAFSIMACIISGMALILTAFIEYKKVANFSLLIIPRLIFLVAGLFMMLAAFSFIGYAEDTDLADDAGRYADSFIMAWISVGTAIATSVLAHFHHTSLTIVATEF